MEIPTEKIQPVVDLTGIRDMLHEFMSGIPARDIVESLLEEYQVAEQAELKKKLIKEIINKPGRKKPDIALMTDEWGGDSLTIEERMHVNERVNAMPFAMNMAKASELAKSEFKRYMDFPVPKLQQNEAANGTVKTFGDYFSHATTLVDMLHKGESISPDDAKFLLAFSSRLQVIGTNDWPLLIPEELKFMAEENVKEDNKKIPSLLWEQLERYEAEQRVTRKFNSLQHATLDHEFLVNDAIRKGIALKIPLEAIRLPKFTLPTTEKAVFNAITGANWRVADAFRDPFGGKDARTATMTLKIERPEGLLSDQPLLDLAKLPGLSSLKVIKLLPEAWNLIVRGVLPQIYNLEIPRAAYDAVISPIADAPLRSLKMDEQNAKALEKNVCDPIDNTYNCCVTDEQLPVLKNRLDALKISYDEQPGLTYITFLPGSYTPAVQQALAPFKDMLMVQEKSGEETKIYSKNVLEAQAFKDLSAALQRANPKKDYTVVRANYLIFEPDIYEQQLAPVIKNLDKQKLGSLFPEAVREAAEQAVSMQSPVAGIPLPAPHKKSAARAKAFLL